MSPCQESKHKIASRYPYKKPAYLSNWSGETTHKVEPILAKLSLFNLRKQTVQTRKTTFEKYDNSVYFKIHSNIFFIENSIRVGTLWPVCSFADVSHGKARLAKMGSSSWSGRMRLPLVGVHTSRCQNSSHPARESLRVHKFIRVGEAHEQRRAAA